MAVRRGPIELGDEDTRRVVSSIAKELRDTRIGLGLGQPAVARAAGISPSQLSRIELGRNADPSLGSVARVGRALGLSLSARLYPEGSPVRDAGQQRLIERFAALPALPLRVAREVGLPAPGDLRAWDASVSDTVDVAFVDAESRLGDIQALERRLQLKLRDDRRGRHLLLVVARSRHNDDVLRHEREALRELLPLDGPAIAKALRSGRLPPASGLIVL
jgi:transcriptional regulator with XRE-family HTH domain